MRPKRTTPACTLSAVCLALAAVPLYSADYTWMDVPADASWNTSSLNWNAGAAWVDGNDAIFPATSSQKKLTLSAVRTANNVTVNGTGYTFSGSLMKVAGKFTVNFTASGQACTLAEGFGGESVRIGGNSVGTLYMGWGKSPTVKTTYLEGTVVIAPNSANCFGPSPSVPSTNIVVSGSGPSIFFNNNGSSTLGSSRFIRLVSGSTLHLGAAGTLTLNNLAADASSGLDFSTDTIVDMPSYWSGAVVLNPTVGTTNAIGRLSVGSNAKVTGGVTRLGAPSLATGTGALLYVNGNASAFSATRGNLVVEGGTLYASQASRYVEVSNYGQVTVRNGGRVDMPGVEWLNGLTTPGRLVVMDGEFTVDTLRLSQSGAAKAAEITLGEGGVMRVSKLRMDNASKAVFAFNGGAFQSTRSSGDGRELFTANAARWANVSFTVGEKGAVFDASNGVNIWWDCPLASAVAPDGGIRKFGSGILIFKSANAYNGPTLLESGHIQARADNVLPVGSTLRLGGADVRFTANTYESESPARHTVQSIGRVEGRGALDGMTASSVTGAIAPAAGGTIEFMTTCSLSGDYEVSADANGCSCLKVAAGQNVAGLALRLMDAAALDKDADSGTYKILDAPNGFTGVFAKAADWPAAWGVKYAADGKSASLRYLRGTKIVFR